MGSQCKFARYNVCCQIPEGNQTIKVHLYMWAAIPKLAIIQLQNRTCRTDSRRMQESRMPVEVLAVVLNVNTKHLFHLTQWSSTSRLWCKINKNRINKLYTRIYDCQNLPIGDIRKAATFKQTTFDK